METPKYNKKQNARIDELLMLAQQSNAEYGSTEYRQIVAMMQNDDQIVKDTVFNTLASSTNHH
jgi:phosphopantetheine adenylyltransferase